MNQFIEPIPSGNEHNNLNKLRENFTPTPEEFLKIMQGPHKPDCATFCESGSWRSREFAEWLRKSYNVDAVAIEGGASELSNINVYNSPNFHIIPERVREETILRLGQIPIVIAVLNKLEFTNYSGILALLQTHIDRNKGIFIHAVDNKDAIDLWNKQFKKR